jgi:hypothetical protein
MIAGERAGILAGTAGLAATFIILVLDAGFAQMYTVFILLKKRGKIKGVKDYCKRVFKTDNLSKATVLTVVFCLGQFIPNIIGNSYLGNPWYLFIYTAYDCRRRIGRNRLERFFQPVFEERITFVPAAALSGVVWAFWHIPLWFVQNAAQSSMNFGSFLWHCVVLHAWTNVLGLCLQEIP